MVIQKKWSDSETHTDSDKRHTTLQGKDLIGISVLARDPGEEVGRVKEVLVHRTLKSVVGFLVKHSRWLQQARGVPFSKAISVSRVELIVASTKSMVPFDGLRHECRSISRYGLDSTKLVASNGHNIGRICDVYFDDKTGVIDGFEIQTGISENQLSSRVFMPLDEDVVCGEGYVLVGRNSADRLMFAITKGGRKNSFLNIPELQRRT